LRLLDGHLGRRVRRIECYGRIIHIHMLRLILDLCNQMESNAVLHWLWIKCDDVIGLLHIGREARVKRWHRCSMERAHVADESNEV
jgi:hypothetical protein